MDLSSLSTALVLQFRSYGARFGLPSDPLELMTMMQHHGVPTRLLDWSENALAGLYFAVRESGKNDDGGGDAVVWVLEPRMLAEIQKVGYKVLISDGTLLGVGNLPLPFLPVHHFARVTAQRGTFTLHPFTPQHSLMKRALAEQAAGRVSPLRGIRIRGSRRTLIRDTLANFFGMGEFTLFPDLDGLSRELRMREGLVGKG